MGRVCFWYAPQQFIAFRGYELIATAGRETFLAHVEWENDWPVVNGGKKIALQTEGPGLYQHAIPVSWRDDFSSPKLQLGWYRKSKSARKSLKFDENPLTCADC